jgi:hypothetical protein
VGNGVMMKLMEKGHSDLLMVYFCIHNFINILQIYLSIYIFILFSLQFLN